jgi:probable rRNA maturation factor
MEILIEDKHGRHKIAHEKMKRKARTILNALGYLEGELSVVIVDDSEIAGLNKQYLGRSGATNVLAFPMQQGRFRGINPDLLGDVVISLDTTVREANDAGLSVERRFDQLLIHGILHLLGFDHEETPEQAQTMMLKEEELLRLLCDP